MPTKVKIEKVGNIQRRIVQKVKKNEINKNVEITDDVKKDDDIKKDDDVKKDDDINVIDKMENLEIKEEEEQKPKKRGRKKKEETTDVNELVEGFKETNLEEKPKRKRKTKKEIEEEKNKIETPILKITKKLKKTDLEEHILEKNEFNYQKEEIILDDKNIGINNHSLLTVDIEDISGLEKHPIIFRMDIIGYKSPFRPYLLFVFFMENYRRLDDEDFIKNNVLENKIFNKYVSYQKIEEKESGIQFYKLEIDTFEKTDHSKIELYKKQNELLNRFKSRETFFLLLDDNDDKIWDFYYNGEKEIFKKRILKIIEEKYEKQGLTGIPIVFNQNHFVNTLTLIKKIIINF